MKPIETTLRKLSMLYEFNRKLRAFTFGKARQQADPALGRTAAAGKKATSGHG